MGDCPHNHSQDLPLSKANLIKAVHTRDADRDDVMNVLRHRFVMCP